MEVDELQDVVPEPDEEPDLVACEQPLDVVDLLHVVRVVDQHLDGLAAARERHPVVLPKIVDLDVGQ